MSTTRRSRAMPTDGPTVKFLYTIIKQLDLKAIDWNVVASQLEISNGHAARMRYSRFRQQMEGITSTPRAPRAKKAPNKSKAGSCKADVHPEADIAQPKSEVKQDPGLLLYQSNPFIKDDPYGQRIPSLADIPQATSPQMLPNTPLQMPTIPYPSVTVAPSDLGMYTSPPGFPSLSSMEYGQHPSPRHLWAPVKAEPEDRGEVDGLFVKVEKTEETGISAQCDEVEYQGTVVVDIVRVGQALGYTNPASVANRFRLLRKRHGFNNLECTIGSGKSEENPSAASTMAIAPSTATNADETAPESSEDGDAYSPVKRRRVAKTATRGKDAKASLRPIVAAAFTNRNGAGASKSKGAAKAGNPQDATNSHEDEGINSYLLDAVDKMVQEEDLARPKIHNTRGKA
ncbi:hypothetical protein N8T08_006749 [Aspergillus melleus]|uniref:Uncharacterized protein n=1 Tax=Aspergillus melleus TaxID=138277 RepID=A0ACC3B009_9EURO|nr:hypothetical protein N8T08_006749 [Aspergillus melleus]